jgi:hypothetical protein
MKNGYFMMGLSSMAFGKKVAYTRGLIASYRVSWDRKIASVSPRSDL